MVTPRRIVEHVGIKAAPPGAAAPQAERFGAGRTCEVRGCETVLSVYNPRTTCWQHEARRPFVHQAPRKTASAPDERRVITLRHLTASSRAPHGRMPGPEPEPTGPEGPPPVPQPAPQPNPTPPPREPQVRARRAVA